MKGLRYKFLSHTADLRLEVYGKSLEDLFNNAALALADILVSGVRHQVSGKTKEKIKIKSANLNFLLTDFLNEILARSHISKKVYKVYKVIKLKDMEIEAELVGYKVEEFEEDVKAVTYTEVDIRKEKRIWKTKLVMDI